MDLDPVFLSRIQFAFVISFHIIFPSFTIGLAAWLATIEGARLVTGNPLYRRVFDFWLKVFAVSFGMGVVTGIVMAFQFGTNWGVLAQKAGSIQGPLLGYEAFTAFMLEATFFGVMLLGRDRVSPRFYFFACCMVSLGTMFSSFWILANNSWMQVPLGHTIVDGKIIPADWSEIVLGSVMMVRWPHMLLAAFLTTGMCVAATGAWYVLRGVHRAEARVMLHWGLGLVAVLIPIQLFFGHLTGLYVLKHQPAKFAAIEARWKTQQPASEVLLAIPDEENERNLYAIEIPKLGSMIASGNWTAKEIGLEAFPKEDRPPVLIPFFGFRLMVGMGLIMLAVSWLGNFLRWRGRLETTRWFLWGTFLAFPTGFVAVLCGWFTAEVGRQPWVVYGLLRTKDAVTPSLTTGDVLFSLACYVLVYAVVYSFGAYYIYKLLHEGPTADAKAIPGATGSRPMAFADSAETATGSKLADRRIDAMEPSNLALFWAGVIAVRDPALRHPGRLRSRRRRAVRHDQGRGAPGPDDGHDRPVLGWQRDLAGGDRRRALRGVSRRLRGVPRRVLPPGPAAAVRPDLPRRRVRVPLPQRAHAPVLGLGVLPRLDGGRVRPGRRGRGDDSRHPGHGRPVRRRSVRLASPVSRS